MEKNNFWERLAELAVNDKIEPEQADELSKKFVDLFNLTMEIEKELSSFEK
jgi:hypothetical protein